MKSLFLCVLFLCSLSAHALEVEYDPAAENSRALLGISKTRVTAAALAGHKSKLLKDSLIPFNMAPSDFDKVVVTKIKSAPYGAISVEIAFDFPEDSDPCSANLNVISYRNGKHSVRKTLVYGGAMQGEILGVMSCED